jgi:putative membrane protein
MKNNSTVIVGSKIMRRGIRRSLVAGVLALIAAAFPAAGFILASQQVAQAAQVSQASGGSLKPVDREFITVIRFANLWEIPMGQLATKRGTTQTVRDVGAKIAADHTQLNIDIKKLADQFGVTLPDQPTSSQRSWIAEISSKNGPEFDQAFANRLRGAHGTVFGLVSEVRAGTDNEAIRAFAEQANVIVMRHMTLLESTGLVAPTSMFAEASARTTAYPENSLGRREILLAIGLGLAAAVATLLVVRSLSSRGSEG